MLVFRSTKATGSSPLTRSQVAIRKHANPMQVSPTKITKRFKSNVGGDHHDEDDRGVSTLDFSEYDDKENRVWFYLFVQGLRLFWCTALRSVCCSPFDQSPAAFDKHRAVGGGGGGSHADPMTWSRTLCMCWCSVSISSFIVVRIWQANLIFFKFFKRGKSKLKKNDKPLSVYIVSIVCIVFLLFRQALAVADRTTLLPIRLPRSMRHVTLNRRFLHRPPRYDMSMRSPRLYRRHRERCGWSDMRLQRGMMVWMWGLVLQFLCCRREWVSRLGFFSHPEKWRRIITLSDGSCVVVCVSAIPHGLGALYRTARVREGRAISWRLPQGRSTVLSLRNGP